MSPAKRPKKARSAGPAKAQPAPSSSPINPMVRFGPENPLPLPDWGGGPCPEHLVELIYLVPSMPAGQLNSADLPPRVYSQQTGFVDYVDPIESAQAKLLARDYDISLHEWDEWAELVWPHLKDWQRSMFDRVRDDAMQLESLTGEVLTEDAADDERWLRGFGVFERFFVLRRLVLTELSLHLVDRGAKRALETLQSRSKEEEERFQRHSRATKGAAGRDPKVEDKKWVKQFLDLLAGTVVPCDYKARGFMKEFASRVAPKTSTDWFRKRLERWGERCGLDANSGAAHIALDRIAGYVREYAAASPAGKERIVGSICNEMKLNAKKRDASDDGELDTDDKSRLSD